MICRALARLLGAAGYEVETFTSGNEFLQRTPPGREDCVLLDVEMPEMTGPEVRNVLREMGCAAPVIFITAHRGEPIARHLGPELAFFKPIEGDALLRAIADARPIAPRGR